MISEALITSLTKIGNHKAVMGMCEPNIMESLQLKEWMVKRTLVALTLLQEECDKDLRRTDADGTGTI